MKSSTSSSVLKDSVIAMTGHKDLKLADHYSKIDGEVQKTTSLKILDHIRKLGA